MQVQELGENTDTSTAVRLGESTYTFRIFLIIWIFYKRRDGAGRRSWNGLFSYETLFFSSISSKSDSKRVIFHLYMGEVTMVTFTKYEDWMILQVYHWIIHLGPLLAMITHC